MIAQRRNWWAAVAITLVALPGCIAPGGPQDLEVTILLDDDVFKRIEEVSGVVEIINTGDRKVTAAVIPCSGFTIQRVSDGTESWVMCRGSTHSYQRSFAPRERLATPFSFNMSHQAFWEDQPSEVPQGNYGLSSLGPIVGGEASAMVFFKILEDT